MTARWKQVALAAAMITAVFGIAIAQDRPTPDVGTMSAEDIVKLRQEIMTEDGKILKEALRPDAADRAAAASHLIHNVEILKTLWPDGSTTADSDALPQIWTDRATFIGYFDQVVAKAGEVKVAAGDAAAETAALKAVGGLCGQCHTAFRKPE